jgi:hypothetical protein
VDVIIKGMEMPQAGDMIIYGQIDGKLQCTIVTRGKPTKWCETSEVSEPHGRLIDADALIKDLQGLRELFPSNNIDYFGGVISLIKNSPTIIETEVGE